MFVTWTVLPMSLLHFWAWEHFSCIAFYVGSESSGISSITSYFVFHRVSEVLQGLERHEGDYLMTELSFLVELFF